MGYCIFGRVAIFTFLFYFCNFHLFIQIFTSSPYYGTHAFEQVFNVRFIHALVRNSVLNSKEWKEDYLPVSQFSEAGTLTFFCQIPIECLLQRGIIVSEYEKDCCWQVPYFPIFFYQLLRSDPHLDV